LAVLLLSRFAPAAGLVTLRQTFALRRHGGGNGPCWGSEDVTEILQQLRRDLALRYLDDRKLHVSKIAWLLGFHEVGAFTHAFKRWTGKTPSQLRTAGAYLA
jgi:AraC-like DNA-binding protein